MSSSADAPEWAEETPNWRDPEVARFTFDALFEASTGHGYTLEDRIDDATRAMLQKIATGEPTLSVNGNDHHLVTDALDNE